MDKLLIGWMIFCGIGIIYFTVKSVLIYIKNAPLDRQVREDLKAEQRRLDGLK